MDPLIRMKAEAALWKPAREAIPAVKRRDGCPIPILTSRGEKSINWNPAVSPVMQG